MEQTICPIFDAAQGSSTSTAQPSLDAAKPAKQASPLSSLFIDDCKWKHHILSLLTNVNKDLDNNDFKSLSNWRDFAI